MSARQFKKGDPEFSFFANFYPYAQAYWEPERSEQYHKEVLAGSDKLWKTFSADKDGKPLPTISAKRIEAIIQAFALFEEHSFLYDFIRFADRFNEVPVDGWRECLDAADGLIDKYGYDESWRCRMAKTMVSDFVAMVYKEMEERKRA